MFFDNLSDITRLAARSGCTIFVVPDPNVIDIKNALILEPGDKSAITADAAREFIEHINNRQTSDQFLIIRPADKLNLAAASVLLKSLEEPKSHYHFVLLTATASSLLPTILSRSAIYILKSHDTLSAPISADDKIKALAKQFIAARPADLPALAEQITKKKDNAREYALTVLSTAIEILYKSYFLTNRADFVRLLPKFLKTYENITANGHLKLHLIADLL